MDYVFLLKNQLHLNIILIGPDSNTLKIELLDIKLEKSGVFIWRECETKLPLVDTILRALINVPYGLKQFFFSLPPLSISEQLGIFGAT